MQTLSDGANMRDSVRQSDTRSIVRGYELRDRIAKIATTAPTDQAAYGHR